MQKLKIGKHSTMSHEESDIADESGEEEAQQNDEESEQESDVEDENENSHSDVEEETNVVKRIKKSVSEDKDETKKPRKKGIVYLSSIPKYMNVAMVREMFSNYGEVGRIFLQVDDKKDQNSDKPKTKKKYTRTFTEGWVEFERKRTAKQVAEFLNNKPISTRKGNRFYDILWNIKYLPRFKWVHLSERLAYEKAVYKQKMRVEIAQARKEAQFFQNNLDLSERLARKRKKEEKLKLKQSLKSK